MYRLTLRLLAACVAFTAPVLAATDSLKNSPSSFERSFASSPVNWMAWGPAVMEKAKAENKPIYLMVGFSTNELSQAMLRQSFSNAQVSALLNESFVCAVLDRDEYPAIAALYQTYVSAKKQLTGWPLNIWLTPDLQPLEGATYLPPSEEWGKEGFINVVQRVTSSWAADVDVQRERAAEAAADTIAADYAPEAQALTAEQLQEKLVAAEKAWLERFDATSGGFSEPPKYPEPELIRFLVRRQGEGRDAAIATLRAIAAGALRDPLDGGFYRYSTDGSWRVPYFQKHTTDQARLALAFLDAAVATQDAVFAECARGALDFALQHLRQPDGSFVTAVDATADDVRSGYAWTEAELLQALGTQDGRAFAGLHGVSKDGNVSEQDDPSGKLRGKNVLLGGTASPSDHQKLSSARAKLLKLRQQRAPYRRDENVVTATQGLMIQALSRAAQTLNEPRFAESARQCSTAARKRFAEHGELRRLAGSEAPAVAADFVHLGLGYLAFGKASGSEEFTQHGTDLLRRSLALLDPKTGRFHAGPAGQFGLWHRPFSPIPGPSDLPSAESTALRAAREQEELFADASFQPLLGGLAMELDEMSWPPHGGALIAAEALSHREP